MRVIVIAVSVVLGVITSVIGADSGATKSLRALKMDGYDQDALGTLEIQINVGKKYLIENEKNPAPVVSPDDKKNGYFLFVRNYLFDVHPYTNPKAEEISKKEIKIFAAPGEYEPVVFSVYPLTELKACKISVSEFINEKGEKLDKDSFQINNVLNREFGSIKSSSAGDGEVQVRSEVLDRASVIPLIDEGICKTIWLNVKVPDAAKDGTYKGKVKFAPSGKPAKEIEVEIKVLAFKLQQPPDMNWAPIMAGSWDFGSGNLEKEFIQMKEHGMTGEVTDFLKPEGENYNDFTKANKYMELAKKAGLTGKFVLFNLHMQGGPTWDSTFGPFGLSGDNLFNKNTYNKAKDVITKTRDNAVKNKWLPYMFYLTTELGYLSVVSDSVYKKTMKCAEEYYAAAREVKDVRLMATFNRQDEMEMHWNLPALDEFGLNSAMFPAWQKAAKQKPSWMTFILTEQRCGHGFYLWKYNIKGVRPWSRNGCMVYYNNDWHPNVRFERIREGVDDYKYVYTLTQYIKEAKAKGKDTASAETVIKKVMEKIPDNHDKEQPNYDYTRLDDFRWEIAAEINKLLK
ncbi:MAG: hypothetical protein A2231_05490 [Candidatus Firestonebacteria bacterium RIFOXYA2_FULL_40_8]|nr:MAG: hypothetical protein A2231_05490 [Candidatus Firestonebacteria bacterium RIFOXYA2_FULL_40_8]